MRVALSALVLLSSLTSVALADGVDRTRIATLLAQSGANTDTRPFVASAPDGLSMVVWMNDPGLATSSINFAILAKDGSTVRPPQVLTIPAGRIVWSANVAATRNEFMIVYDAQPNGATANRDIFFQILDRNGLLRNSGQVNPSNNLDDNLPNADGNEDGEFAIAWRRNDFSQPLTGGGFRSIGVFVRVLQAGGTPATNETRADLVSYGLQFGINVGLWKDDLVVAWHDGANGGAPVAGSSPDGWGQGIVARFFSIGGSSLTAVTGEVAVPTDTSWDQFEPIIEVDYNDTCVIGWCGDSTATIVDAYVRRFNKNGTPLDTLNLNLTPGDLVNSQFLMDVGMSANGEAVATWMSQPVTAGEPESRPGYARLDQNGQVFDQGLLQNGGSSNEDMAFVRIGVDEYGNFNAAWRSQSLANGANGITTASFRRDMISFQPPTARAGLANLINIDSPSDANRIFVLAASLGDGPIPVGNRTLRIADDFVFQASVYGPSLGVFNGFIGTLDASGRTASPGGPFILLPAIPGLSGITIYFTMVTDGPSSPGGINTIADTYELVIQ